MKYYLVSDVHGFYTKLKEKLEEKGFFKDKEPHKLIVCGDLFDRGPEALELQNFILELMEKDEVILIKGNHEDLTIDLLTDWTRKGYAQSHHISNGTVDTVLQLTNSTKNDLINYPDNVGMDFLHTPYLQKIIPNMVDYFETDHYVFVHGWIPCKDAFAARYSGKYEPVEDWRNASDEEWDDARWINGMDAAHSGYILPDKTIVCGHYRCSYGHCHYEHESPEYGPDANFDPYYAEGIIAIDACTAYSDQLNCIVIED